MTGYTNRNYTRTSSKWKTRPGNFDRLKMEYVYPTSSKWGIPDLLPLDPVPDPPKHLTAWHDPRHDDGFLHFFIDDYRFEGIWSNPENAIAKMSQFPGVLTPDFSAYTDWPLSAQLWNFYRNRWVGRHCQEHGLTVIPTVGWSTTASYDFCFDGIPEGSPVALTDLGVPKRSHYLWHRGFCAMIERINPVYILFYGKPRVDLSEYEQEFIFYETRNAELRAKLKARKKEKANGQ